MVPPKLKSKLLSHFIQIIQMYLKLMHYDLGNTGLTPTPARFNCKSQFNLEMIALFYLFSSGKTTVMPSWL